MKKVLITIVFFGIIFAAWNLKETKAQSVRDEVYTKENVPAKEPLEYSHLREADVMWSKKLWQMIDCRKKMNHPLYFPTRDMRDRKSLIQLIVHGIQEEGLTVYESDLFKEDGILSEDEALTELGAGTETTEVQQDDGSVEEEEVERGVQWDEVTQYLVKEQWYFDKKHSTLKVRILGICPIREYVDDDTGEKRKRMAFWVYFPEARPIFAKHEVFNRENDAQRISFDDFFHQRRFDSYVTKESNVYGNRDIQEYTTGENTLLEAEEIRNEVFEFEHDLWEY
ncbi:MAG: gliding motility protein GldN [Bacteroidales bacterium]